MFKQLYYLLHSFTSKQDERREYSGGYWQHKVREEALGLCGGGFAGKIIEIGCGEGLLLKELALRNPQALLWGVDNNAPRLKEAEARCMQGKVKNITLLTGDAKKLPFDNEFFDAVVCVNVLFNLGSIEQCKDVLREMKRICKKKGKIIFDFRNSANILLKAKYKFAPCYDNTVKDLPLKTYSFQEIAEVLDDLHFSIIRKKCVGLCFKKFAPIIVIEVEKC